MTDTKQLEPIPEIFTVEVNQELQSASITSEKHKSTFIIGKTRASRFFSIRNSLGTTPIVLSGKFTSLEVSVASVLDYLKNAKETFSVKSDRLHEERQQRKNAKPESKDS